MLTAALREIPENVSLIYLLQVVLFSTFGYQCDISAFHCVSWFLCNEMKYCAADYI